ncbi:MAG: hypothetical protein HONBIEJF_00664 [Fimbriimonadaceae bacterium]|nr:hypothetical protein [Fimbriimonadaceae bacterium]
MLIVAGMLVAGCGDKSSNTYKPQPTPKIPVAKVNPGEEGTLFPFTAENQWVYEATATAQANTGEQRGGNFELTFKIAKVDNQGDSKVAQVQIIRDGKVESNQRWVSNSKGLYQASSNAGQGDFSPMQPQVMFPIAEGGTFSWTGNGPRPVGKPGTYTVTSKVIGPQEVDTGLGRISAIAIESKSQWADGKKTVQATTTQWWAPGVGLVRYVQNTTDGTIATAQTLKLKSHTLKN